jgi:hypothetical protein
VAFEPSIFEKKIKTPFLISLQVISWEEAGSGKFKRGKIEIIMSTLLK